MCVCTSPKPEPSNPGIIQPKQLEAQEGACTSYPLHWNSIQSTSCHYSVLSHFCLHLFNLSGMTDRALRDELMTMLVAGQETSAILLGWTCALLAHHPDVQVGRER